jgi:hypothetical protein
MAIVASLTVLAAGCGGGSVVKLPPHHNAASGPVGGTGVSQVNEGLSGPLGTGKGLKKGAKSAAGSLAARSGVLGGDLFGGNEAVAQLSGQLGRNLAIVRVYYTIGDSFPWVQHRALMAHGSTLLVSLDTHTGGLTYAQIAAGQADAQIRTFLGEVNQSAIQYHLPAIYMAFEHEADDSHHVGLGTPAQFVQAWDHIHALAVAAHLDWNDGGRIHWALILSHMAYEPMASRPGWAKQDGWAGAYWPGAGEVDIVAADGYNSGNCQRNGGAAPLQAPASLFNPVVAFAQANGGLPVFISEFGSIPNPPQGIQTTFIQQMQSYVASTPQVAAALFWEGHSANGPCNYTIDSSAIPALAAMGHSPVLQGTATG